MTVLMLATPPALAARWLWARKKRSRKNHPPRHATHQPFNPWHIIALVVVILVGLNWWYVLSLA
jgi:hypothetical protein